MYRILLLPLDGSNYAEQVIPLALSIAGRAGATVYVVRVHVPYTLMDPDNMTAFSYQWDHQMMAQERAYLDGITKRLTDISSVPVTSTHLEGPAVAETIHSHATASGADLIVMTTHGRGPLSRFWLGSVADELVRRATTPVLLMRPQETAADLTSRPVMRHILIPLDGSALAEQVLESVAALGRLMEAEYSLLRVYGQLVDTGLDPLSYAMVGGFEPPLEQLRIEAEDYLKRVAQRLKGQGDNVQTHVAIGNHPASAILDTAQTLAVDLIALETHGYRGLTRLLLGSVADKVLRGASVPLLIHRSAEK